MANTVIALKRSDIPFAIPSNLANGELAINYADGKLFYKNTTGDIVEISGGGGLGGNYFGTVNANGTFLISDTSGDVLSIKQGDNIIIIGDAATDSLTISANLVPAFNTANTIASDLANTAIGANNYAGVMANAANAYAASLTPDLSPPFNIANAAYSHANAAFDRANLSNDVLLVDTVWVTTNAAYDKANVVGSDLANTAFSVNVYSDSVGSAGNAWVNTVAIAANAWSNTKLSNTSGVTFEGNLTISSDLTIGNNLYSINSAFFDTSTTVASVEKGQIVWNGGEETFDLGMANGSVLQVGQEILYRVKNQTGSTITEGTVVMAAGTLGASGRILVTPAISNGTYPSKYLMGIATGNIPDGADGYVTHFGKVRGLDTSMWSEGDILYANVSVPGALQNTAPSAPNTKTTVAIVVSKHATTGTLFVRPTYGSKLNEDELVELDGLTNGDVIQYVSANGRFENRQSLVNAYGVANAGFDKANAANVLAYNTGIGANAYAVSVGTAGNSYAQAVGTSGNAYAQAVGAAANATSNTNDAAGNAWTNTQFTNAQNWANGVGINANTYSASVGTSTNAYATGAASNANLYAQAVGTAGNSYAQAVGTAGNAYTVTVGTAANSYAQNWANGVGANANTYASAVGTSANAYATGAATNANLYSTAVGTAGNAYAVEVGTAGNAYTVTVGTSANAYAGAMANSVNVAHYTYANATGTGANNYSGAMANAGNAYAVSVGTAGNSYAVAVGTAGNTWATNTFYPKTGGTISGDVTITGNVTISGVTTYANTQTLLIGDNILSLNADLPVAVAPSENSGVEVNRGSSANVSVLWNETVDKWTFTNDGTTFYQIASNADIIAGNAYAQSIGTAGNSYAQSIGTAGNSYAQSVGTAGNAYTQSVGTAGNNYTVTVATAANNFAQNWANGVGANANTYASTVGTSANAYASGVGANANTYAAAVGTAANTYIAGWANGKFLANTTGTLAGSLTVTNSVATPNVIINNDGYVYWGAGDGSTFIRGNSVSDLFTIGTSGSVQFTLNSSGNVGIGTTSPGNKLEVVGGIAANNSLNNFVLLGTDSAIEICRNAGSGYIDFKTLSSTDYDSRIQSIGANSTSRLGFFTGQSATERLSITAGGNVGVGNTVPLSKLHVTGGTASALQDDGLAAFEDSSRNGISFGYNTSLGHAWIYGRSPGTDARQLQINNLLYVGKGSTSNVLIGSSTDNGYKLLVQRAAGDSQYPDVHITDGTQWLKFNSNTTGGSFNSLVQSRDAQLIYSRGTVNTGGFVIAPWSGASDAGLRMDASGNVSIGTATTTYKLQVSGTTYLNGLVTQATGIWHTSSDGIGRYYYGASGRSYYKSGDGSHEFRNSSDAGVVFIDTSGNLGVGTTPAYKLDVATSARIVNHTFDGSAIELNSSGTGNRYAYIDFHGDDTYTDYGFRIIRYNTGPNAGSELAHRGTGTFSITTTDAAPIALYTNNTNRLYIMPAGNVVIGGITSPAYTLQVNGSFAANTKSFVIDHPSKPGMKLRYGSLEGPENGVYIRGRLTNEHHIQFPDYWKDLVDIDSVTVQLTPIGKSKQPSVGDITDFGVNVIGKNIDCFYFIQAERKDVEKLVVEFDA